MKKVVVVGAGDDWRILLSDVLEKKGYEVAFYIDSYVKHPRVKTIKPDEASEYIKNPEDFIFMFTFPLVGGREVVMEKLKAQFGDRLEWWDYRKVYKENREVFSIARDYWMGEYDISKAKRVVDLFEDEMSKHILNRWINFRETHDIDYLIDEYDQDQYLPKDIPIFGVIPEEYNFMDVGAYTGDTFEFFIEQSKTAGKSIKICVGFEPDSRNFEELLKTVERLKREYPKTQFITLKAGCGDKFRIGNLYQGLTGVSSSIEYKCKREDVELVDKVCIVKPDDIFHAFEFHVIKMDTEGYEMPCLRGLKRIIQEYKPVLMVSLYHRPEDIYEIPNFIKELNPSYRLYVRVHGTFFMETVLYALPSHG